jgi:spore coat polysaccharide biosynthesis predicted glycosyltransferase SpsG
MRITFDTDGNHRLGMGHVYRCLALAKILKSRFADAEFCFVAPSIEARGKFEESGCGRIVEALPQGDLLIFDRLSVPEQEISQARTLAKLVVSFDDTGPGHFAADLSVNALYRCKLDRPASAKATVLQGLGYAMIDPAFAVPYDFRPQARNLFITQGGADTYGMVPKLVRLADAALPESVVFHIHTGPAFQHEDELARATSDLARTVIRHRRISDLPGLMASMDLAIAAGGVMSLELAAVGVPLLLITAEAMETETMMQLAEAGAALDLGYADDGLNALPLLLPAIWADADRRRALSCAARNLIDAQAGQRIVDAIAARLAA